MSFSVFYQNISYKELRLTRARCPRFLLKPASACVKQKYRIINNNSSSSSTTTNNNNNSCLF